MMTAITAAKIGRVMKKRDRRMDFVLEKEGVVVRVSTGRAPHARDFIVAS
jgi:hypothetical protein